MIDELMRDEKHDVLVESTDVLYHKSLPCPCPSPPLPSPPRLTLPLPSPPLPPLPAPRLLSPPRPAPRLYTLLVGMVSA